MNRRSSGLSVSNALVGYFNTKAAQGLSPRTSRNYRHRLKQWAEFVGDVNVTEITPNHIRAYLTWLRTGYKPRRYNGDKSPLSPKTLRNAHMTLCSFFTWAAASSPSPTWACWPIAQAAAPRDLGGMAAIPLTFLEAAGGAAERKPPGRWPGWV